VTTGEVRNLAETVRASLLLRDEQQLLLAETRLEEACAHLQGIVQNGSSSPEQLTGLREELQRLAHLVDSAGGFYLGLISEMRVQLQGYGRTPLSDRDQAASRFAVEG
jgi:hypothetical protein